MKSTSWGEVKGKKTEGEGPQPVCAQLPLRASEVKDPRGRS